MWLPKKVAQAQAQNTDISPVVDRLSLIGQNGRNRVIRTPTLKSSNKGNLNTVETVRATRSNLPKVSGRKVVSYGQDGSKGGNYQNKVNCVPPEGNRQTQHLQNTLKTMLKG